MLQNAGQCFVTRVPNGIVRQACAPGTSAEWCHPKAGSGALRAGGYLTRACTGVGADGGQPAALDGRAGSAARGGRGAADGAEQSADAEEQVATGARQEEDPVDGGPLGHPPAAGGAPHLERAQDRHLIDGRR